MPGVPEMTRQQLVNAVVAALLTVALGWLQRQAGLTGEELRVVQQYLATTEGCR